MTQHETLRRIASQFDGRTTDELTDLEIQIGELLVAASYLQWANEDDNPKFGLGANA